MQIYIAENRQTYPAAYIYDGMAIITKGGITSQVPDKATNGYLHWSYFLYGEGRGGGTTGETVGVSGPAAFLCPSLEKGGLPPTNTTPENLEAGQTVDDPGVVDKQAPRCAYTVNEAICCRNKFLLGFQGATRTYHFVRAAQVTHSAATILASEWHQNWEVVSAPGRDDSSVNVCKSHRPVNGFFSPVMGGGWPDLSTVPPNQMLYRVNPAQIDSISNTPSIAGVSLNAIGRNHGTGAVKDRKTNFLYADGHVETKLLEETVSPTHFEWGDQFFSLTPGSVQ
jgi:prepilin-type processing-associated H-X9-DG protein